jgi:hypothetical protein
LPSKNINVKIHGNTCNLARETCSVILREENRSGVSEKKALRKIFVCKRVNDEVTGEEFIMKNFMNSTPYQKLQA